MIARRRRTLGAGLAALAAAAMMTAGAASAQTSAKILTAVTGAELHAALTEAGLSPNMLADAQTGAPVARAQAGDFIFFVRTLDCAGRPPACSNLLFFINFNIGRPVGPGDFRLVNRFNERQVFGRAYIIESTGEVGVDYVIDLKGGVSPAHLAQAIARWADVINAFIDNFQSGAGSS